MNFADYKTLQFERRGRILTITLNRPEKLNSLAGEAHTELSRVFYDVVEDKDSDIIVVTGAGKAFSAGGDIQQMQKLAEEPRRMYGDIVGAKRLVMSFLDLPQPVIAKINGAAMGLGSTLALFSDITFAATQAKIADPHVRVGFVAGDGGAVIWPHLIGLNRAKHYLLTGEPITGQEAADIGLVNFAYPIEELDAKVNDYAQRLAGGARRAIQWTKATLNIPLKQAAATLMDAGMAYETLSNHTQDHAEAVDAFLNKRAPRFSGD